MLSYAGAMNSAPTSYSHKETHNEDISFAEDGGQYCRSCSNDFIQRLRWRRLGEGSFEPGARFRAERRERLHAISLASSYFPP